MTKKEKAAQLNGRANNLEERGALKQAIKLYQRAARVDPHWPSPLYNLGLLFKNERRWAKSLQYNRRATAVDPKLEPAWWNLGIAATALGRWDLARLAWQAYGLEVPGGDGPVDFPCGYSPIRLDPEGDAEIVWANRIDPARAVLASIPFPESKHCWGDVVLNDGAPNGYRTYQGQEVPVLDALQLLERSVFGTYMACVTLRPGRKRLVKIAKVAAGLGGSAEDWSTSTRLLCRACSEGRLHESHDTAAAPPDGVHWIGIAARSRRHAAKILSAWEAGTNGIKVESLDEALPRGRPVRKRPGSR
jgi:hypothetical protein